ncbi:MAG: LON peptidase substrate-binding domain-containing protein [Myxococcales bacterium]|nr:LON peptidase substrate-binding domain-containing protein [Myxococcales bacterium]
MNTAALTPEELARLPVFPLPRVVFFPGSTLPLHLFEPRYRAMIEHCMSDGPQAFAVALLEPGYEAGYEGRPAIRTLAGVGRIVAHEAQRDGTHDVLLQGLHRVRLEELHDPSLPFRTAKATIVEPTSTEVPLGELQALLACATQVAQVVRAQHPDFAIGTSIESGAAHVADTLADRFVAAPEARQAILEELDLRARVSKVMDAVGGLLAMLATRETPS